MDKTIITVVSIIIIISAGITAFSIYRNQENKVKEGQMIELAEEEILDDCTDEYEEMQKEIIQTNSGYEKISPNAAIILKTNYKKCGHTTSKYMDIPEELVNKTKEELQKKYKEWNIEKFSDTEIVLNKEEKGECGEHYMVKNNNGKVTIYEILEDGTEKEYETTNISIEYLTETDKVNMQNGIKVYGKQALNQLIEDFE